MKQPKVILLPGNGGMTMQDIWFPSVKTELEAAGLEVVAQDMPDSKLARENRWLPFLEKVLEADEQTLIIGYSFGAVAAMRYAETHQLFGSILVGASYTDLGDEGEKLSGYFNRPWNWEAIKGNQEWIAQFVSSDDPYIPVEEGRHIRDNLSTDYHEAAYNGHFGIPEPMTEFPELINVIKTKLGL